jgi:hypothetical protein
MDWNHFVFVWFMNAIPGSAGFELWFLENLAVYMQGNIWETLKCVPHETLYSQFCEMERLFSYGFHNS